MAGKTMEELVHKRYAPVTRLGYGPQKETLARVRRGFRNLRDRVVQMAMVLVIGPVIEAVSSIILTGPGCQAVGAADLLSSGPKGRQGGSCC